MRKNNKPVRSENLTSGQIFFKEDLIWLVPRDTYSKELFSHSIYTIQAGKAAHDTIFSSAPQMTSQFTIISFNHTFFRPSVACVFSNV